MRFSSHGRQAAAILFLTGIVIWSRAEAGTPGDAAWSVQAVTGPAQLVASGMEPRPLKAGDQVEPGHGVVTGRAGQVTLASNGSAVIVAPDSRMEVAASGTGGGRTTLLQTLGTLFLQVDRQPRDHFEVRTPYLAAVVKGTVFSVTAEKETSTVQLDEGSVAVTDLATGRTVTLAPGQRAQASLKTDLSVTSVSRVRRPGQATVPAVPAGDPSPRLPAPGDGPAAVIDGDRITDFARAIVGKAYRNPSTAR